MQLLPLLWLSLVQARPLWLSLLDWMVVAQRSCLDSASREVSGHPGHFLKHFGAVDAPFVTHPFFFPISHVTCSRHFTSERLAVALMKTACRRRRRICRCWVSLWTNANHELALNAWKGSLMLRTDVYPGKYSSATLSPQLCINSPWHTVTKNCISIKAPTTIKVFWSAFVLCGSILPHNNLKSAGSVRASTEHTCSSVVFMDFLIYFLAHEKYKPASIIIPLWSCNKSFETSFRSSPIREIRETREWR